MLKAFGIIYKITNTINGKIYIGQTVQSIGERWSKHKYANSHSIMPMAIKKYGEESFLIEPIYTAFDAESLTKAEIQLIKYYDCLSPKGYNRVLPEKNQILSEETRAKKSSIFKKKYKDLEYKEKWLKSIRSEERKNKISKASKEMWSNPEKRKLISLKIKESQNNPTIKEKYKQTLKDKFSKKFKPIYQWDENFNLIKIFYKKEELEINSFSKSLVLNSVRFWENKSNKKSKKKSAHGFCWSYGKNPYFIEKKSKAFNLIAICVISKKLFEAKGSQNLGLLINVRAKDIQKLAISPRGMVKNFIILKKENYSGDIELEIKNKTTQTGLTKLKKKGLL